MASSVRRWRRRVPGSPRTSVMYSRGLHATGTRDLNALNALPLISALRSGERLSIGAEEGAGGADGPWRRSEGEEGQISPWRRSQGGD